MTFRNIALVAAAASVWLSPASAVVVTSLPGGVAVPIPDDVQFDFFGPHTLAPGVTFSATSPTTFGLSGLYSFVTNGDWIGTPMIGLDSASGSFQIAFADPVGGFLADLNWTVRSRGNNATIAIYNSSNVLLESLTLESGGNLVAPGYRGFSRNSADISFVRLSNEFIGVRDITVAGPAIVPEPASWALLIAGFGLVGAAARRRRSVAVA